MSPDFVAHMEDVLDPVSSTGQALYAEPYDPQRPVVCFDETSTRLLADVREPIPTKPGRPKREDYEYRREGTRNLFLFCEPLAGWRHVAVTERRTTEDFACQMRWLVDQAYPEVPVVRLVFDNLNTHWTDRSGASGPNGAENSNAGPQLRAMLDCQVIELKSSAAEVGTFHRHAGLVRIACNDLAAGWGQERQRLPGFRYKLAKLWPVLNRDRFNRQSWLADASQNTVKGDMFDAQDAISRYCSGQNRRARSLAEGSRPALAGTMARGPFPWMGRY